MNEEESIEDLLRRRHPQKRTFIQGMNERKKQLEERERERLRQQQEQRDRRKNYSRYSSSFLQPQEVESFHDIEILPEPEQDAEQWYIRFQIMSDNHYPIDSRARAKQLLNMKPGEVALNKQLKLALFRIMHPDKGGHPNATRFFQMLTDAIDIIENRGSGKRNRKTHKRRAKTNKRNKRRKNRSRKY